MYGISKISVSQKKDQTRTLSAIWRQNFSLPCKTFEYDLPK